MDREQDVGQLLRDSLDCRRSVARSSFLAVARHLEVEV
jgi:hypothetical protein